MSKPIDFLVENQPAILQAYGECQTSPKKTWDVLKKELLQLEDTMTYSTFKQYLSVFIALSAKIKTESDLEMSKIRYERTEWAKALSEAKQELTERDKEIETERAKLSKLSQVIPQLTKELSMLQSKMNALESELSKPVQNTKNIDGWTVRLTTKGYYHLCKSIGGKVKSIYLGKVLDFEKARKKITEHMSKVG